MPDAARQRWQCRRGMRELDLLLTGFLQREFENLDAGQQQEFEKLLAFPDQVLQEWLLGHSVPTDSHVLELVERIRRNALDGR